MMYLIDSVWLIYSGQIGWADPVPEEFLGRNSDSVLLLVDTSATGAHNNDRPCRVTEAGGLCPAPMSKPLMVNGSLFLLTNDLQMYMM